MNYFDVKARERERAFVKRIKNGAVFKTGSGCDNFLIDVSATSIYFRTAKSKKPLILSREKFRKALSYMFRMRTGTRDDLEPFSNFTSAMLGLIRLALSEISKVSRTLRGALRITLRGVRFWFSGVDRSPNDIQLIGTYGTKTVLMSYFHIRDDKQHRWKQNIKDNMLVLLDSGEFSRWKAEKDGRKTAPILVEDYARFIEEHKDVLAGCINLDVVNDPEQSRKNADYLKRQGLAPIEVWHCESSWTALDELVRQDPPVIAIGGSALLPTKRRRELFNELFERYPNNVNFHLLGGSSPLISEYPWFSADSSSWLVGRMFRKLVTPTKQMKAPVDWKPQECLIFNIQALSTMEENYNGVYSLPLVLKPSLPIDQRPTG